MVITEAAHVPEPNDDRLSARTLLAEKSDMFTSKFSLLLVIPAVVGQMTSLKPKRSL